MPQHQSGWPPGTLEVYPLTSQPALLCLVPVCGWHHLSPRAETWQHPGLTLPLCPLTRESLWAFSLPLLPLPSELSLTEATAGLPSLLRAAAGYCFQNQMSCYPLAKNTFLDLYPLKVESKLSHLLHSPSHT